MYFPLGLHLVKMLSVAMCILIAISQDSCFVFVCFTIPSLVHYLHISTRTFSVANRVANL